MYIPYSVVRDEGFAEQPPVLVSLTVVSGHAL
jgi:hypothetical protein